MIKAVLLDLDNTLLINPDNVFVVEYLRLVEDFFVQQWGFKGMARILRESLRAISKSSLPQHPNSETILDFIGQEIGRPIEEIRDAFNRFLRDIYPSLKNCVSKVEVAPKLVSYLQKQGYALVIATNPIYPAEAIRQRLVWAGLPDDLKFYSLVTHAENMHFAKPDPAYYAEILARVGVEPDEAMMVGDKTENDIEPAAKIGLHTYLITDRDKDASAGTLSDFYHAVSVPDWEQSFTTRTLKPEMIEPQLRGNVGALFGMLSDVKGHFWTQHPDPNEWSILQIVCHLLESENIVQRPRLERILKETNPFLVAPKAPPGPQSQPSHSDGYQAAREFLQAREVTIRMLQNLKPEDWYRPARHSIFGPTSLLEMALFTAQHDRLHLNQLCQTLGNCK